MSGVGALLFRRAGGREGFWFWPSTGVVCSTSTIVLLFVHVLKTVGWLRAWYSPAKLVVDVNIEFHTLAALLFDFGKIKIHPSVARSPRTL